MNKQIHDNGFDIADSLYGNGSGVFQVRNRHGSKIAEFPSKAETKAFLRKQDLNQYEVWHLESKPGALVGVYPGAEFINQ